MSSGDKMELSLDEILKSSKKSGGRGRGGRRNNPGRPAASGAPVGGVAKNTRQNKPAKANPAAPAPALGGETKIMVSNLVSNKHILSETRMLTFTSLTMLSKTHFRYVRPLQVFEPTVYRILANQYDRTNETSVLN